MNKKRYAKKQDYAPQILGNLDGATMYYGHLFHDGNIFYIDNGVVHQLKKEFTIEQFKDMIGPWQAVKVPMTNKDMVNKLLDDGIKVTLNGRSAQVQGFRLDFPIVRSDIEYYEWSWSTVERILKNGGSFVEDTPRLYALDGKQKRMSYSQVLRSGKEWQLVK